MAKTNLTAERLRELLHYCPDTGVFRQLKYSNYRNRKSGDIAGRISNLGYVIITIDRLKYTAHRLAWLYVYGEWPSGQIDHINGERSDNKFANLRDVPQSINQQNRKRHNVNNKAGFLGTSKEKGFWIAQILVNGMRVRMRGFDTPEQAHAAYLEAKRLHHPGCTI